MKKIIYRNQPKNIFIIPYWKKYPKIKWNVSIYFIYILVEENLFQKNKAIEKKQKINEKYLNDIKNYHERVKSSQIPYNEYIEKGKNIDKKEEKNKIKKNKNNSNIKNPWIRLYEQNKILNSKKIQNLKEKLEQEKKIEDLTLTFKPKINDYSRKLVENNYNGIKVENRLMNYGKLYEEKNKSKRKIINEDNNKTEENKEIKKINIIKKNKRKKTLTPINNLNYVKKSKVKLDIVKTKDKSKDKNINKTKEKKLNRKLTPDKNFYEYLYLESKILQKKRDEAIQKNLDLTCPFKPKLNDSFNKNIQNNDLNVFQRLYNAKNENRKIATEAKLRRKFNFYSDDNLLDYENKKNFKYRNNLKTYNNINNRNSPKNDNSYINSINKNINNDNIDKDDFNKENKKNYIKKSYITILKAKYIKYFELFNCLDSDKDGIISYKKIKLSTLDSDKLISLTPLLYEIQYKGLEVDFPKFCEKIQNLN